MQVKKKVAVLGGAIVVGIISLYAINYLAEKHIGKRLTAICEAIKDKKTRQEVESAASKLIPEVKIGREHPNQQLGVIDSYIQLSPYIFWEPKIGSLSIGYEYQESIQVTTDTHQQIEFTWLYSSRTYWVQLGGNSWARWRTIETAPDRNCKAQATSF